MRRAAGWGAVVATLALAACGGKASHSDGGQVTGGAHCADLFDQDAVRTYSIEIDPAVFYPTEPVA